MAILDSIGELIALPNLRPLDIRRDLMRVADLIELCFAHTMDVDGKEYLRQMRQAARDARFLNWAPKAAEWVAMPLSGYVWEESGQIVGNLSLIPMSRQGRRIYLIANVAVHPDYRRRGIARALTQTALEGLRHKQIWAAWLQVRDDNSAAHHLYQSLGFIERAQRTSWEMFPPSKGRLHTERDGVSVTSRQTKDWAIQKLWLTENYPPEVDWNLNFHINEFRPGLLADLLHLIEGTSLKHWAVRRRGYLTALLTWQPSRTFADNLWLAMPDSGDNDSLYSLLTQALHDLPENRSVAINFPSRRSEDAFIAAGFENHLTLIWMEAILKV
ncbi:MAG TPA: GNAT family N-acetyltransferase [Anaerolineaceae bacterium]